VIYVYPDPASRENNIPPEQPILQRYRPVFAIKYNLQHYSGVEKVQLAKCYSPRTTDYRLVLTSGSCAAEQRDNVASPHGRPSSGLGRTLPHPCARTPLWITAKIAR